MVTRFSVILAIANALLICGLVFVGQHNQINSLRGEVRAYQQMQKISDDQMSELQYLLMAQRVDLEAERTRSYVSGVVDSVTRPDHANEIWHAGYDRGQAVQEYADQVSQTTTRYTETPVKSDN